MSEENSEKKGKGEYTYKLSKKMFIEELPEINGVQFSTVKDEKERDYIDGFTITVENITKSQAEQIAQQRANNLTKLMCSSCGKYSESFYHVGRFSEGGSISSRFSFRAISEMLIPVNFNQDLLAKMESDEDLEQKISRLYTSLKGFVSNNPEAVIRELFNIVGDQMPKGLEKYSALRHVLSHRKADPENIEQVKKHFGENYFDFTDDNRFDYNSEKNLANLTHEAYEFYDAVKCNLLGI